MIKTKPSHKGKTKCRAYDTTTQRKALSHVTSKGQVAVLAKCCPHSHQLFPVMETHSSSRHFKSTSCGRLPMSRGVGTTNERLRLFFLLDISVLLYSPIHLLVSRQWHGGGGGEEWYFHAGTDLIGHFATRNSLHTTSATKGHKLLVAFRSTLQGLGKILSGFLQTETPVNTMFVESYWIGLTCKVTFWK